MIDEQSKTEWRARSVLACPGLYKLQAAWRGWAAAGTIPSRALFDPFEFPTLLPLMLLAEVIDVPNAARPYDMLYRYVGTDFSTFFDSGKVTRARLSDIGAPFDERWFAVSDAVLKAKEPCYFIGNPIGTAYAHVSLEMLALPLARPEGPSDEVGFVLSAFSRVYPDD